MCEQTAEQKTGENDYQNQGEERQTAPSAVVVVGTTATWAVRHALFASRSASAVRSALGSASMNFRMLLGQQHDGFL